MTPGRTTHMLESTPVGTHLLPHLIWFKAFVVVGLLVVVVVGPGGVVTVGRVGEGSKSEK